MTMRTRITCYRVRRDVGRDHPDINDGCYLAFARIRDGVVHEQEWCTEPHRALHFHSFGSAMSVAYAVRAEVVAEVIINPGVDD